MNDFKYKPTKAFWKIQGLLKNKSNDFVIQGGQGASKTISILMLLIDLANRSQSKEISIISDELSKMKRTVILDFLKIVKDWNIQGNWNKSESKYYFENKSFVEFLGLDVHDVGKGMRRDVVYGNEANKLTFEAWRQIASRAKRRIIDFNPDSEFWGHELITDNNFISLTYQDNEYLPQPEIDSILETKKKAYFNPDLPDNLIDKPENIKSKYWLNKWHVYGLGIVGTNPNRIFFWNKCTEEKYKELDVPVYYGVDWGKVDPFGIIEVKYYDGELYIKELNYQSENEIRERLTPAQNTQLKSQEEGLVKWLFSKYNINRDRPIICDSNRPEKIRALRQMGYGYAISAQKGKGSILAGIELLSGLEVYYTENSKNVEAEQLNYCNKVDRYGVILEDPEDDNNHIIDPTRYVAQFLLSEGIIRNI